MVYVKKESVSQPNFLASADFVSFTYQISNTGVTADAKGRKIVPAGTVYPANDATAIGILLSDVDVTNGPQPGAVLVEAWVLEARLPVAPVAAAKTALAGKIKFKTVV
ncbi:hypothetical protein KIH86_17690 [Paenibacillus sp. HN-1]|uniref:hypothetical protein n=1 Tax=Paenibacillus TaxID=44249 RepID=UPI001CA8F99F|nr:MULTISPECIES: hypothetical protein [Paenibacillus]MBY9078298.1 hypothetical protein [Paenibacillus sp. CGMCC 1.18879]MBY9086043.1 hypothetical protein [Paenibacillus sinensis]